MHSRWKKLSEEVVLENAWWRYKRETYQTKDNRTGEYHYAESNGSVFVVPLLPDGTVLLIVQYRYLDDKLSIEFPGGGMKLSESPEAAAKRELLEETGWTADKCINIGTFEPANGFVKDTTHLFLAYLDVQGALKPDETEQIEILYRRPDEVEEMVRTNEIWDGQTLASWAIARHHI